MANYLLIYIKIRRIETIHNKNLLYRDIKPENFMLGRGKASKIVYVIDFGLIKKFKDKYHNHI